MTMTVFTSSYTQGGYIWAGSAGDGFFVAPGVAVTDTSAAVNNVEDYIAFIDTEGSSTAQIDGSVTAAGAPLILGNGYSGSGTANIQIGSGGSVNGDNATYAAIQIHQNLSHGREGELITNAGVIDGAGQAISSNAYGSITNNGAIYAGSDAVDNFDGVSTDTVSLFNHGTISGGSYGVIDTGGHVAVIYNSGAIDGGAYAVFSDAATTETLTNYAAGTLSGGVDLQGTATFTNEGSVSGGTTLEGAATLANSGTMDKVSFTGLEAYNSFTNSGLLTGGFSTQGVSFTADNSGTIDGSMYFGNTGASLTDSGTIKQGVFFVGGAGDTSNISIADTGLVASFPTDNAFEIANGAYDISNDGKIIATGAGADGVDAHGAGKLVNDGAIHAGGIGVNNDDSNASDTVTLENHGTISGGTFGVSDTGGHNVNIFNTGAIDGGPSGDAVYSGGSTSETLTNYATGTISGGVYLAGYADVINEGSISGGTSLGGVATVINSGTMGYVDFTDASSGSLFTNSGLVTQLTANGASFIADNSGTIVGGVDLSGDGASLTDSGTIKLGLTFAGSAAGTTTLRITSTGVVTSVPAPGYNAVEVSAGAYDISTAGEIVASGAGAAGVDVHGGGTIVNRGKIVGGTYGVANSAKAGVTDYVYNYGSIDASQGNALLDDGGHTAHVVNYGTLAGGSGYAGVAADSFTVESLYNGGTIEGGVDLGAAGSTIVNTGTIDGLVDLWGGVGSYHFTNSGLINGDITFTGTGNVYNGAAGSVTGTIHGAGADGVYYGGNDGETFDMTASGAKLVVGGSGSDTFKFTAAGLTRATTVQGGGGTGVDTLDFTTAGAISASQLFHVSGIEQIDLANGTNSIALTDALVASASQAALTLLCGSGADTINASGITSAANKLTIDAGQGVDNIAAGGGTDTFVFTSTSQSTGAAYDTISGANWALDKFDLNGAPVTTIDKAVTVGSLSTATFDSNLAALLGPAHLGADAAVLLTPSAGTLAGHTFLVEDTNGIAGYQAGKDLVFDVTGAKGALSTGNFI